MSDRDDKNCCEQDKTSTAVGYGGQAVIEGVMMRSPRYFAVACRRKDTNEIIVKAECVESYIKRFQWMDKPFLRGALALIDAFVMGAKALMYSANIAMESIPQSDKNQADNSDKSD